MIRPISSASLKEVFIREFEKLIFSGYFKIGEKLPPERELAKQMGVSRPVVHEGLVELVSKGLVTMVPRRGTMINDYRKSGSLFLLTSLFEYADGRVSEKLLDSMLDLRQLFETENARLAAGNRSEEHLAAFHRILGREEAADSGDAEGLARIDYDFHHLMAMASDNLVYPLLLNSMKEFYLSMTRLFFSDPGVVSRVTGYHRDLVSALEGQEEDRASDIMAALLRHGKDHLKQIMDKEGEGNGKD